MVEKAIIWIKANPYLAVGIGVGTGVIAYVTFSKKAQQSLGLASKSAPRRRRKLTKRVLK